MLDIFFVNCLIAIETWRALGVWDLMIEPYIIIVGGIVDLS